MYVNISIYSIDKFKIFQKWLYKKVKLLSYITSFLLVAIWGGLRFLSYDVEIYLACAFIFPFCVHAFAWFVSYEQIKNNLVLKYGAEQTFEFDEDGVKVKQKSINGEYIYEYIYTDFLNVYKWKKYYFIFVTRTNAFIMDRDTFIVGKEEEFDSMLKQIYGKRFINKAK